MSSTYTNKQIKLFSKIHQEFLNEYNTVTNQPHKIFKIKKGSILLCYYEDVLEVLDDFLDCKESCLDSVTLIKLSGIDPCKVKINWKYLHNLFWIVKKDNSDEILERSKASIAKSEIVDLDVNRVPVNQMMPSNIFGDIIKEISGDIQKSLQGKDLSKINPSELLSNLMNGDSKVAGGIDFTAIIERSSKSLKEKIKNGDIDLDQLKSVASDISGKIPGFFPDPE